MNLTVSVKRLTSKKASSGRMKHFWLLSFLRHACSSVKYHCWFSFSPSSASRGLLVGWVCSRLVIILPQAYIKLETSLRSLPADADFWHDPTEEFEPQLWFWIHHPLSYLSISSFHSRVFITAWTLKIWLQALQLQLGCDLYSGGKITGGYVKSYMKFSRGIIFCLEGQPSELPSLLMGSPECVFWERASAGVKLAWPSVRNMSQLWLSNAKKQTQNIKYCKWPELLSFISGNLWGSVWFSETLPRKRRVVWTYCWEPLL